MKQTKGFTLVELLVVVAIIALLVSILLPTLSRARELAKQVKCAASLNAVHKGWILYAHDNNDAPPKLPDIVEQNLGWDAWKRELEMGDDCLAFGGDGINTGGQQNLCLLVKAGVISWDVYLCPSTETKAADRSGGGRKYGLGGDDSGGTYRMYIDYGIQIPYARSNPCPLRANMNGGIAIIADRSDRYPQWGGKGLVDGWSMNHPDDGENILYASGSVTFSKSEGTLGGVTSKNTGGWGGNNIYTTDSWSDADTDEPSLTGYGSSPTNPASTRDSVIYFANCWWY